MKIGYHPWLPRLGQRRGSLVTGEAAKSLTWELSVPRIVAFEHAEQSRAEGGSSGPRPSFLRRRRDGAADRAMLWAGRPSGYGRVVCPRTRAEGQTAARGADVRDDHGRAVSPARLAGGTRGDARGDGEHGGVLEARVLRARGGLHVSARQCRAHQAGPGAQDLRQVSSAGRVG